MSQRSVKALLIMAWMIVSPSSLAETVRVAVASNFADTLRRLAPAFQSESGHQLKISVASTGKLYAQILHGAPFDVFLAADGIRPQELIKRGYAHADTLTTYARGQLVLWKPTAPNNSTAKGEELLRQGKFRRLAIANPKTAPYGVAAVETLRSLGLWKRLNGEIARGENIAQTFHFVNSGAADLGFVAGSQLKRQSVEQGLVWAVPPNLYSPILQQGVVLRKAHNPTAARTFIAFLSTALATRLIIDDGYLADGET